MSTKSSQGPVFDPGLCRCCGMMKKCRILNVEYENRGQKEVYSDLLLDCYGLMISYLDGKPSERLICATCVVRLRDAFDFRKQVMMCEEAFLQLRLEEEQTNSPEPLVDDKMVEVIVKLEPCETEDRHLVVSPCRDMLDDRSHSPPPPKEEPKADLLQELPEKRRRRPTLPRAVTKKPVLPTGAVVKGPPKRLRPPSKPTLPVTKLQQMNRERDPAYMTECNILTIVEFSYAVPFKCRHNNLICYYCGMIYLDPEELRTHVEARHPPKFFRVVEHKKMMKLDLTRIDCRLCPAKIPTLEAFKHHIDEVHQKKYYDCKEAVLPFKLTKTDLKCQLCAEVFPYFHALNKHMNEHFRNYVCETCGLGFVDQGRFMMHQQRHDVDDFPCPECGKNFKGEYNRELHIDRVHKKRGRVYCPKCDVALMSYPQKLKHLVEVHGEEPMSFPCNLCDRVLETRRKLTIHKRKDHLKDFRYECQYCGQKFFTRFALNNHMPTHTGERNFKCKVCEKSYPRLKTLKDHMRIHTNDRRYRCHICGQAFVQNCSLKGHLKSQHPEYG